LSICHYGISGKLPIPIQRRSLLLGKRLQDSGNRSGDTGITGASSFFSHSSSEHQSPVSERNDATEEAGEAALGLFKAFLVILSNFTIKECRSKVLTTRASEVAVSTEVVGRGSGEVSPIVQRLGVQSYVPGFQAQLNKWGLRFVAEVKWDLGFEAMRCLERQVRQPLPVAEQRPCWGLLTQL